MLGKRSLPKDCGIYQLIIEGGTTPVAIDICTKFAFQGNGAPEKVCTKQYK